MDNLLKLGLLYHEKFGLNILLSKEGSFNLRCLEYRQTKLQTK